MFDCWKTLGYALFSESTKKEEKKNWFLCLVLLWKMQKKVKYD